MKDSLLTVRVEKPIRSKFYRKAKKYGTPSEVLREIVEAFVEDRLTIVAPENKESLYVTRSQD